MPGKLPPHLTGISETLLITLYGRASETQRPDAIIRDEKALEIVRRMDCDLSHLKMHGHDEVALAMRVREFDRITREFLNRHPSGVVVHLGCGLDTRFERVDNGQVEWYDLDLPDVIELRKKFIGEEGGRYHLLAGSAFDVARMEPLRAQRPQPFLFIAEGVLPYFDEAQVKTLLLDLRETFPGSELVCDAHAPFVIWADNLQLALAGMQARLRWGLKHGRDVEQWGEGIALLEEWFFFDRPEPRLNPYRWMRHIRPLAEATGIFHYRLGQHPKI